MFPKLFGGNNLELLLQDSLQRRISFSWHKQDIFSSYLTKSAEKLENNLFGYLPLLPIKFTLPKKKKEKKKKKKIE